MKILRFSRTCSWPMNSSSVCGRSASSAASSSARLPVDQAIGDRRSLIAPAPAGRRGSRASSGASAPSRCVTARDRAERLDAAIAEIDQRRDGVLVDRTGRRWPALRSRTCRRRRDAEGGGLVLQLGGEARGELRPDAGRPAERSPCPGRRWRGRSRRATASRGSTAPPGRRRPAPSSGCGTSRARRSRGSRRARSRPRARWSRPARVAGLADDEIAQACATRPRRDSRRR